MDRAGLCERLRQVDSTQPSITGMGRHLVAFVRASGAAGTVRVICSCWLSELVSGTAESQLALMYLANEVLQSSRQSEKASIGACRPPSRAGRRRLIRNGGRERKRRIWTGCRAHRISLSLRGDSCGFYVRIASQRHQPCLFCCCWPIQSTNDAAPPLPNAAPADIGARLLSTTVALLSAGFAHVLPRALAVLGARSLSIVPKVKRMLGVWADRAVFPADIVAKFEEAVDDPDSILTGPWWWWPGDFFIAIEAALLAGAIGSPLRSLYATLLRICLWELAVPLRFRSVT
jgi:hypothetical protein